MCVDLMLRLFTCKKRHSISVSYRLWCVLCGVFFFQAEDGIRDLVRSRGLGDLYKGQVCECFMVCVSASWCV